MEALEVHELHTTLRIASEIFGGWAVEMNEPDGYEEVYKYMLSLGVSRGIAEMHGQDSERTKQQEITELLDLFMEEGNGLYFTIKYFLISYSGEEEKEEQEFRRN